MARVFPAVSLLLFSCLVMGYLWWGRFQYFHGWILFGTYACCLILVVGNHVFFRDGLRRLGFRWDNWKEATRWFGGSTLLGVALICLAGIWWGERPTENWTVFFTYFLWAGVQQYLLQNFFRLRVEGLLSSVSGWGVSNQWIPVFSALIAAGAFALFHWPNMILTGLTLLGGFLWCWIYSRIPNFFWAWISQFLLAMTLLLFFEVGPMGNFQVGRPGHRFDYYGDGVLVGGGYSAEGEPFVVTIPGPERGKKAIVRVFSPKGELRAEWIAFEGLDYSGQISAGDLGFAAGDEIVVSAGPGASCPPWVQIFDAQGRLLSEFQPREIRQGHGVWATAACGKVYICPGPGPGAEQTVLEYDPHGVLLRKWSLAETGFQNGLRATAVCEPSQSWGEDPSPEPKSLLVWGSPISVNASTVYRLDLGGTTLQRIDTLPTTFGANVSPLWLRGGRRGIAVAPGPLEGYPPWVKIYSLEDPLYLVTELAPYEGEGSCGANVAAVDTDGDQVDELIFGEGVGPGRPATVRIIRLNGTVLHEWDAYP